MIFLTPSEYLTSEKQHRSMPDMDELRATRDDNRIVTLRRDGIAKVYPSLTRTQAIEISAHLRAAPCYPGHVRVYGDGVARSFDETAALTDVWCHDLETVVDAPHFWELAVSLLPQAARYLDAAPHLYSMNAFWTRASGDAPMTDLQTWHRDYDDDKFLALFVYGTDVLGPDYGPHMFQRGTHVEREPFALRKPYGEVTTVYGPAGTAFFADTRGLHMGLKPTGPDPRLILWARYGVSDRPRSYDVDRLSPVPAAALGSRYPEDAETRDLVRLVVA